MASENVEKKKKPNFWRRDWHKKIKLGKHATKNKRKWRAAKGRQNKIRLGEKGYPKRPRIGYGEHSEIKGRIDGYNYTKITHIKEVENLKKGDAVLLSAFGTKKRKEIIALCEKKGLVVLNKYLKEKKK